MKIDLSLNGIAPASSPARTGNVALTCRYFGISRHTYYNWFRRDEEFGVEGLRDRSKRPLRSPNATSGEVIGKIVYLRKTYHFGPEKISMYLKRYHDLQVSRSGVWRILKRLEKPAARARSATGATSIGGSATRSPSPVTACRWT